MEGARVRLLVAACLFVGWIGWLAYLVFHSRGMVILSRPQFLVADAWVVAHVDEQAGRPAGVATIRRIVWPEKARAEVEEKALPIAGLPTTLPEEGWAGPGTYILALSRLDGKTTSFQLTLLPPSPGFHPKFKVLTLSANALPNDKKKKEQVARLMAGYIGKSLSETEKLLQKLPLIIIKVPADDADKVKALMKIQKELEVGGAFASLRDAETRIYPATPQAMEQLEEMRARK